MVVPEMGNVYWGTVNAIPDSGVMTAAKAFARSYVRSMENILMVNAYAIRDGKARSAHCVMMNVKLQIVAATDTVRVEIANACGASKGIFVKKVRHCFQTGSMENFRICSHQLKKIKAKSNLNFR